MKQTDTEEEKVPTTAIMTSSPRLTKAIIADYQKNVLKMIQDRIRKLEEELRK